MSIPVVTTLKAALMGAQALKNIKDLSDSNQVELRIAEIVDRLIETQTGLLELLQSNLDLVSEKSRLADELRKLKEDSLDKANFERIKYGELQAIVYQNKDTKELFCPLCFERGLIRTLQSSILTLTCKECKSNYNYKSWDSPIPTRY